LFLVDGQTGNTLVMLILLVGGLGLINLRGLVARLAQVKTYSKGAPFYNALIRHVARSRFATLLHVAQNEEFEGDRSIARTEASN